MRTLCPIAHGPVLVPETVQSGSTGIDSINQRQGTDDARAGNYAKHSGSVGKNADRQPVMSLEKALWVVPLSLALHNLEEAIWLPAWSEHAGFWMAPVGTTECRVAAALLAGISFRVAIWAIYAGAQSVGAYVIAGFAFAVLLNVGYHVAATVTLQEYAPGVAIAVAINLPVMSYVLVHLFRERWINWPGALLAFIAVPLGIVLLIPVLFWVGRAV